MSHACLIGLGSGEFGFRVNILCSLWRSWPVPSGSPSLWLGWTWSEALFGLVVCLKLWLVVAVVWSVQECHTTLTFHHLCVTFQKSLSTICPVASFPCRQGLFLGPRGWRYGRIPMQSPVRQDCLDKCPKQNGSWERCLVPGWQKMWYWYCCYYQSSDFVPDRLSSFQSWISRWKKKKKVIKSRSYSHLSTPLPLYAVILVWTY